LAAGHQPPAARLSADLAIADCQEAELPSHRSLLLGCVILDATDENREHPPDLGESSPKRDVLLVSPEPKLPSQEHLVLEFIRRPDRDLNETGKLELTPSSTTFRDVRRIETDALRI
jgi:hypothetical protein